MTSISVPVEKPLTLAVVIPSPAPPGGATFELSSADPSIVAAGDPQQSFLPRVTVPEGQTISNTFQVFGKKVGATTLDATPETPGFFGFSDPLGAWDVNPGADSNLSKFLDANPRANTCRSPATSPTLSTDPNVLAMCGRTAKGAVADGVTQLLMRMVSGLQGTACFGISSSSPPDQGSIATDVTTTQSVGSSNYAFSLYKAPDGYGDKSDSRQVTVHFSFTPSLGHGDTTSIDAKLTIVRPPLMLIHGVWADASTWKAKSWVRNPDTSYFTFLGDYGATRDASFTTNFPKVQNFVAKALVLARQGNYAATQADVVGHSMGGILTRLYAASSDFMRPDNYNMGDIHRFITLDTPHGGSNFANLLVSLHVTNPTDVENSVHSLVGANANVTNGAVCDLSENSKGLALLSSSNLTSQVITATGGPSGTPSSPAKFFGGRGFLGGDFEAELTKCVKRNLLFQCVQFLYNQTTIGAFRFRQANDAIVPLCSQQGGMSGSSCPAGGSAGINFPGLLHFAAPTFSGVTNTASVATQSFTLLDGPKSGFATSLPGLPASGSGIPVTVPGLGAGPDAANFTSQCVTGSPPPMKHNVAGRIGVTQSAASGDSRVTVTSPANGRVFAPGDPVTVTVSVAASLSANNPEVSLPGFGSIPGTGFTGTSYQVSFTIPDTFAGPFALVPTVRDSTNHLIVGVTTTIAVRPTTPPLSLTLSQPNNVLTSIGDTAQIYVTGSYAGGIDLDLTSSASGTTYKSSNAAVVTVSSEGSVKAVGFGTASVTVSNQGVRVFAAFTVEDPDHPLAAHDVTSQLKFVPAGFRVDRNTGFFDQIVQWTNPLGVPVVGPLYFVIGALPSGVTLIGAGSTQNIAPAGSPFFTLILADGITIQPGTAVTQELSFLNPGRVAISYTPKIFRTLGAP